MSQKKLIMDNYDLARVMKFGFGLIHNLSIKWGRFAPYGSYTNRYVERSLWESLKYCSIKREKSLT